MRVFRTLEIILALGILRSEIARAQRVEDRAASASSESKAASDRAESRNDDLETRVPSRDVELHAGHVEIEGPLNNLQLSHGVVLTAHRYRVTADSLTLERTAQGISVKGDGRVAFCPCADPPLTIGFGRATVAPPTDLLLRNSTFRACGVPVLWLPAFWIRSPNKLGLLTPQLAWRGADGPWVATGVHVPSSRSPEGSGGGAELLAGVYLRGGVDLGVQLRGASSRTLLRWDHIGSSFWVLDSSGYLPNDKKLSVSFSVDALRGQRGRVGAVSFERATRNHDRARAELSSSDGTSLYAFGVQSDVLRATSPTDLRGLGPSARWAIGAPLSDFGRLDSSTQLLGHLYAFDQAKLAAQHAAELGFDARPGPATLRLSMHESWLLGTGAYREFDAGLIGTEARASLPLVAEFGQERALAHWLEPLILVSTSLRGGGAGYKEPGVHPISTAQVGLTNKLGSRVEPNAISVQMRAGSVLESGRISRGVASRWIASTTWYAMGGDFGWAGADSWLSTLRARVGKVDRIALRSRLEGRGHNEPTTVRWLLDEAWSPWHLGRFSRAGWLLGEDIDMTIGHQVAVSGGIAYDVVREAFVSKRASASYRHPCGCLAVSSTVDWRVGREGWDAWIAFELMP